MEGLVEGEELDAATAAAVISSFVTRQDPKEPGRVEERHPMDQEEKRILF